MKSLREIKYAKTKFEIINYLLNKEDDDDLFNFNLKELCSSIHISESTFFNYFPTKEAALMYLGVISKNKLILEAEKNANSGIEMIFELVKLMAKKLQNCLKYFIDVLPLIINLEAKEHYPKISEIEKSMFFPDTPEIELTSFKATLDKHLKIAVQKKELPKTINYDEISYLLLSFISGSPLILKIFEITEKKSKTNKIIKNLPRYFENYLKAIFNGFGVKTGD